MLFAAVCFVLFTTPFPAFAANTEGCMEVIAHIETAPAESSPPAADSGSTVLPDNGNHSAGQALFDCIVISLLLLISVPVICLRCKNDQKQEITPLNLKICQMKTTRKRVVFNFSA